MKRSELAGAAILAGAAYLTAKFTAPTTPMHAPVFLAAGLMMVAAGRLADRIWDGTMLEAVRPSPGTADLLWRMPFRLMGGAVGFTVAMLGAKRLDLIDLRDIPVVEIFATGALLAAAFHAAVPATRRLRKALRGEGEPPNQKRERP